MVVIHVEGDVAFCKLYPATDDDPGIHVPFDILVEAKDEEDPPIQSH